MELLKAKIRDEATVLPGRIIKVDSFLNHRVDVNLMRELAKEFHRRFSDDSITAIVTIEASGIALATACAMEFGVPLIFAKKAKSDNIEGGLITSEVYSYTYHRKMTLLINSQWLKAGDRVLIIDDFLANGESVSGLIEILNYSGATIAGIGIAIEKGFKPGGKRLRDMGYDVQSLVIIDDASESGIVFREFDHD